MLKTMPRWLLGVGCLCLVISLTACQPVPIVTPGGIALATPATTADNAPRISAAALKERLEAGESIVLVDTRPLAAWQHERIQGAVNLPFGDVDKGYAQLPKDRFVALYCT